VDSFRTLSQNLIFYPYILLLVAESVNGRTDDYGIMPCLSQAPIRTISENRHQEEKTSFGNTNPAQHPFPFEGHEDRDPSEASRGKVTIMSDSIDINETMVIDLYDQKINNFPIKDHEDLERLSAFNERKELKAEYSAKYDGILVHLDL